MSWQGWICSITLLQTLVFHLQIATESAKYDASHSWALSRIRVHPFDEAKREPCGVRGGSPQGRGIGFSVSRKREVRHQTLYHFPFPDTCKLGCRDIQAFLKQQQWCIGPVLPLEHILWSAQVSHINTAVTEASPLTKKKTQLCL